MRDIDRVILWILIPCAAITPFVVAYAVIDYFR